MGNNSSKQEEDPGDPETAEVLSFQFVRCPLQRRFGEFLYNQTKNWETPLAHYGVVAKIKVGHTYLQYIIHNTKDKGVISQKFRNDGKYEEIFHIEADQFSKFFKLRDIFRVCEDKGQRYDIDKNNCVHACNRIKAFLQKNCSQHLKVKSQSKRMQMNGF